MAAIVGTAMPGSDQRGGHIRRHPCRNIRDHAAVIFIRPDIEYIVDNYI
jgi:hypothetical protein